MTALDLDDLGRGRSVRAGESVRVRRRGSVVGVIEHISVLCFYGIFRLLRHYQKTGVFVWHAVRKLCSEKKNQNARATFQCQPDESSTADPPPREDTRAQERHGRRRTHSLVLVCPVPSRSAQLLRSASCFPPLGAAAPPRRFVAGSSLGGKWGSRACTRLRRRTAPRLPPSPTTPRTSTSRRAPRLRRPSQPPARRRLRNPSGSRLLRPLSKTTRGGSSSANNRSRSVRRGGSTRARTAAQRPRNGP